MRSRTQAILVCTFPLGLTSHNRLILDYSCLRRRRCFLDMAVFLTWSLSSAICRRRRRRLFCTSCYIGLLAVPILPVVGSPAIHTKLLAPTDLHFATA